jgi:hypothetical protein
MAASLKCKVLVMGWPGNNTDRPLYRARFPLLRLIARGLIRFLPQFCEDPNLDLVGV